jgi:ABC-type nitrate/sulfonate/bicarbonate transport system ATPase subunit
VTHNTQEALRLATRVIVLAKHSPDHGSRPVLDLRIPDPCDEDEIPWLVKRLENASEGAGGTDDRLLSSVSRR